LSISSSGKAMIWVITAGRYINRFMHQAEDCHVLSQQPWHCSAYQCSHLWLNPVHQGRPSNHLEILVHCDTTPFKGGWCKGTSVHSPLLISCLYHHPVLYVLIQFSCTKSNLFEPTTLCWHRQLIHSRQPCDIDNITQHGCPSHKLIASTSDIQVQAHVVL
jgi:hypothetical protein